MRALNREEQSRPPPHLVPACTNSMLLHCTSLAQSSNDSCRAFWTRQLLSLYRVLIFTHCMFIHPPPFTPWIDIGTLKCLFNYWSRNELSLVLQSESYWLVLLRGLGTQWALRLVAIPVLWPGWLVKANRLAAGRSSTPFSPHLSTNCHCQQLSPSSVFSGRNVYAQVNITALL